jgi:uncharacterized protein (TIGR00369 family)
MAAGPSVFCYRVFDMRPPVSLLSLRRSTLSCGDVAQNNARMLGVPPDPVNGDYQERIRISFAKQGLMSTLRATLAKVSPGLVEIELRPDPSISQQHGFIHAGALSAIADTAAGYAALSLMPLGRGVLTTEFKINLLAPAVGERILARGRVVKAGRTLTLAQTEVFALNGGQDKLIALLTATLMTVEGRAGISD